MKAGCVYPRCFDRLNSFRCLQHFNYSAVASVVAVSSRSASGSPRSDPEPDVDLNPLPWPVTLSLRTTEISRDLPRDPRTFPDQTGSYALGTGSVGNAPSKKYEDPTLFTLSTFPWAKRSSARKKKAPCWQRMATAMAAPTRVVK